MWPDTGGLPSPIAPIESPFHQAIESKLHQLQGDMQDGYLWCRSITGSKTCMGWNFTSTDNASNWYTNIHTAGCSPAVPDFSFDVWGNFTGVYSSDPDHPGIPLWNPGKVQVSPAGSGGVPAVNQQTWGNPTGPPALTPTSQTSAHDPTTLVVQTLSVARNFLTDFGYAKNTAVYSATGDGLLAGATWQQFIPAVYNAGLTSGGTAPANNNYALVFDEFFQAGAYSPAVDFPTPYTTYTGALSSFTPTGVDTSFPYSGWYATQGCSGPAYATGGGGAASMQCTRSQFYLDAPDIFWFGKVIGVGQVLNSTFAPYDPAAQYGADPMILTRIPNPYGPAAPIGDLYVAMAIPGTVYEIPFPSDTPWVGGYDTTVGQAARVFLFVGITPAQWAAANPTWTVV